MNHALLKKERSQSKKGYYIGYYFTSIISIINFTSCYCLLYIVDLIVAAINNTMEILALIVVSSDTLQFFKLHRS